LGHFGVLDSIRAFALFVIIVYLYTQIVDFIKLCVYKYTCRIWKGIRNGFSKAYPDVAG